MSEKISFTILEAVSYTGLGRTTLYEYMSSGQLPTRKAGRRIILLRKDLDQLIKGLPVSNIAGGAL